MRYGEAPMRKTSRVYRQMVSIPLKPSLKFSISSSVAGETLFFFLSFIRTIIPMTAKIVAAMKAGL